MANKPIKVAAPKTTLGSKKTHIATPKTVAAKTSVNLLTGSGRRIVN